MQRIIASLLLSVFFLTPLAPAALAPPKPVAQHCVRQPLAKTDAVPAGMHCHAAAAPAHHAMAGMGTQPAESAPVSTDHQFRANGCCTSHDCCNSTVRAQWAQFVPATTTVHSNLVQLATIPTLTFSVLRFRFDSHSGRAPPAL